MPRRKALWFLLPALLFPGRGVLSAAATASVSGKVVDETGKPVQGARVELLRAWAPRQNRGTDMVVTVVSDPSQPPAVRYQAISGPDGTFRVSGLPADSWFSLGIAQRGFTVVAQRGIAIPPLGGKVALGTFQLPKGPTVAGVVIDSEGHPLARARIWALSARDLDLQGGLPIQSPGGGPAAVTGPDGRFEIPRFEPGVLEVCRKGFSPLQISAQSASLNRIVLMPPPLPSRISGRVLDDQGMPIAKAEVHIVSDDPVSAPAPLWHPCSPPSQEIVLAYDGKLPPEKRTALTDLEGRFTFDLTGSGRVTIQAEAAGFLDPNRDEDDPWSAVGSAYSISYSPQSPGKIELVLTQGAVLSGRVLTAKGGPAGGAEVWISRNPALSALTDGKGHYRLIGVRPGQREMGVRHPSGEAHRHLEVAPGENRPPDLILDGDEMREIRGRVTGPDGAGVPDASVSISLQDGSEAVPTGPDGSFQVAFRSSRADSTLEIDVETPDTTRRHLQLDPIAAAATPLEIRIDRGARLIGYILGVDRESLPDVSVKALQDHDFHSSRVSRDGEFRVLGLGPGEVVVTAGFAGRCASARVTLEPGTEEAVLSLEIPAATSSAPSCP